MFEPRTLIKEIRNHGSTTEGILAEEGLKGFLSLVFKTLKGISSHKHFRFRHVQNPGMVYVKRDDSEIAISIFKDMSHQFYDPARQEVIPPVVMTTQRAAYLYRNSRPLDGSRCSKLVPKDAKPTLYHKDVQTLYDVFQRGLSISGNDPCLGGRTGPSLEYEWLTYTQVHEKIQALGSWLLDNEYQSGKGHVLGIFSANRIEWTTAEQACFAYNIIVTALYETLGEEAMVYIINQTEMGIILCDKSEKVNKLLNIYKQIKCVKKIVAMGGLEGVDMTLANDLGVEIISYKDVLATGGANLKKPQPPKPDDTAVICYTSGTTGDPKGVVLTHYNFVITISSFLLSIKKFRPYNKNDVYISYLPLAHIYEQLSQPIIFLHGGRIGFFRGDVKLLIEDIQALKPTIFPSVPRLLNRIYDKVILGIQKSSMKKTLFEWGIAAKKRELKRFIIRRDSFWDKLIFNKIQALLGGRVEFLVTGSAPLEAKVMDFLKCAFGALVIEAYGQTECCGGCTSSLVGAHTTGDVGPPNPYVYIKLMDCEEEGYFARDNKGEVCLRGPSIMKEYFKQPQKTSEAIDKDGWLHTGDVGQWTKYGCLKIIDRKKHLFKLSQGEYVAPEKVEIVLSRSLFVAQIFVDGDSLKPFVLAAIVPDEEMLVPWAKDNNMEPNFKQLCGNQSIKDMILADITKVGNEAGLSGFEIPKDIIVHSDLFSVDNELLTPTFKNKRPNLRAYFKQQFTDLYSKCGV